MRVAVIGSRGLSVPNLGDYLPEETTEIVSGGAEYEKYGRRAPLVRNITIIENADLVMAFWDGSSHGTKFVIEECRKRGVPVRIFMPKKPE